MEGLDPESGSVGHGFGEKLLRWMGYWTGLTGGENEWVLEVFDWDDWDEKVSEQSNFSEDEKKPCNNPLLPCTPPRPRRPPVGGSIDRGVGLRVEPLRRGDPVNLGKTRRLFAPPRGDLLQGVSGSSYRRMFPSGLSKMGEGSIAWEQSWVFSRLGKSG